MCMRTGGVLLEDQRHADGDVVVYSETIEVLYIIEIPAMYLLFTAADLPSGIHVLFRQIQI